MESSPLLIRRLFPRHPLSLRGLFGLLGLLAFLSGCGGGPIVATSTGRILYVATSSGIYGFSIMSTGTLTPISSQPLVTNSVQQMAVTPGIPTGQSTPLLLGASGGGSLSVWTVGGSGRLTTTTSLSCSGLGSITGVTVTSDSQYVLVVDGETTSPSNLGLISFSTPKVCSPGTSSIYPLQPAIDCAVSGSNPCILFLTGSSTQTSSSISLATPLEIQVTLTSSSPFGSALSSSYTCTTSACPLGVTFDPTTVFFYASFTGTSPPSLQSIAPGAKSSTSTTTFPASAPVNYPCVDTVGGVVYTPTANGFLYASSTNASGTLSGATAVLTPTSLPVSLDMTSCAVATNP